MKWRLDRIERRMGRTWRAAAAEKKSIEDYSDRELVEIVLDGLKEAPDQKAFWEDLEQKYPGILEAIVEITPEIRANSPALLAILDHSPGA